MFHRLSPPLPATSPRRCSLPARQGRSIRLCALYCMCAGAAVQLERKLQACWAPASLLCLSQWRRNQSCTCYTQHAVSPSCRRCRLPPARLPLERQRRGICSRSPMLPCCTLIQLYAVSPQTACRRPALRSQGLAAAVAAMAAPAPQLATARPTALCCRTSSAQCWSWSGLARMCSSQASRAQQWGMGRVGRPWQASAWHA